MSDDKVFRLRIRDSIVTYDKFLVFSGWNLTICNTGVILTIDGKMSVHSSFNMSGVYFHTGMVEIISSDEGIVVRRVGANLPEPHRSRMMEGVSGDNYVIRLVAFMRRTRGSEEPPDVKSLVDESTGSVSDSNGELHLNHEQGYTIIAEVYERKTRHGSASEDHFPRGKFYLDIDPMEKKGAF